MQAGGRQFPAGAALSYQEGGPFNRRDPGEPLLEIKEDF
jgi:hypothetical protein